MTPEFCQESGFPDARFTSDPHHLPLPELGQGQPLVEDGEFVDTPDEGAVELAAMTADARPALDDLMHAVNGFR